MVVKTLGRWVAALLVLSALLLSVLVPGGPIETRDFSHIAPWILGSFNTFLTLLGLGSFVAAYFVFRDRRPAYVAALLCAVSYFLVYALDLGRIFPVSPTPMPSALVAIEWIGAWLALPLGYLSLRGIRLSTAHGLALADAAVGRKLVAVIVVMFLVGAGIILYATLAAMGR